MHVDRAIVEAFRDGSLPMEAAGLLGGSRPQERTRKRAHFKRV